MRLWDVAHAYHRIWRYRLRTERHELGVMLSLPLAGRTLIDAGANRGVYSYWMHRRAGAAGCVVAFEPQPELASHIADFKRAFRLSRLTVEQAALSDRRGEMTLVRPLTHWGGGSFHLALNEAGTEQVRVPVTTIDGYFAECRLPPVGYIKCDVQGHEINLVRGAARVLATDRPTLLVEQSHEYFQEGGVLKFLSDLDYKGHFFFDGELHPVARWSALRPKFTAAYLNFLYRPREQARVRKAA